ncbi:hypothetical protein DPMN_100283 [Dreissena polymorpha]|uniref:Uncharacterized protein n=1 Tax=Dreissena polymorpha TaxID=45954 RepID=A0A9D4R791_DREPO|nr:hypothetical protein DPMN_100283 [Dreissena polymorpha]
MRRWRGKQQNMLICRENARKRGDTCGYSQWRSASEAFRQSLSGDFSLHLAYRKRQKASCQQTWGCSGKSIEMALAKERREELAAVY